MKHICLFILCITAVFCYSQKEVNAAGGTAKGKGGTVTFTLNSFLNKTLNNTKGYLISGVQQPKEVTSTLAISLVYFNATLQNNKTVQLQWNTVNEYTDCFFNVEKSKDGKTFENLVKVNSSIDSTINKKYTTQDLKPFETTYYRLKLTEKNGKFSYSKTIVINLPQKKQEAIIYPNPASNILYLQTFDITNEKLQYTIVDLQGKTLTTKNINSNITPINLSELANNTYIVNIIKEKMVIKSFKVVKL